jgi:hypothetical protein
MQKARVRLADGRNVVQMVSDDEMVPAGSPDWTAPARTEPVRVGAVRTAEAPFPPVRAVDTCRDRDAAERQLAQRDRRGAWADD